MMSGPKSATTLKVYFEAQPTIEENEEGKDLVLVDALGDDVILVGLVCLVHGFKKSRSRKTHCHGHVV